MTPKMESPQIERVLNTYKNDLWLERRHKINEIVIDLENLLKSAEVVQFEGSVGRNIRDLIGFLQFLERECAGDSFADDTRQWSQLLNLMEISRKLNHKSVKLKDILLNKHVIEAKSGQIRQFNEQARLIRTIEKLIKTFESDLDRACLSLWVSWKPERAVPQDELANILSGQRKLESTLKPTHQNLQACMQNSSIAKSIQLAQFEFWQEKLNSFSRVTERLCSFIKDYLALKREIAHLRPLVGNLGGVDSSTNVDQRNFRIGNSIDACKRDFELVLRFEQRLQEELRKNWTQANRRLNATKQYERDNSRNQQIEFKLIRLLKPPKNEEYSSELYGSELKEALKRAVECRTILDQTMSTMRLEFGRFYFVNDLELLTIISIDWRLAQYSERPENRRLISKLFNNSIQQLLLSERIDQSIDDKNLMPSMRIVGVQTSIGERILLTDGGQESIPLRKRVNPYSLEIVRIFNELQRKLQRCLAQRLEASLLRDEGLDYSDGNGKFDWLLPIQLFDLIERIKFTKRVENCLRPQGAKLPHLLNFYETQLKTISKSDGSVSDLKRSAAISLVIHLISRLYELLKHNVCSASDWNWLKTVRYYWKGRSEKSTNRMAARSQTDSSWIDSARQDVEVRLANSKFPYKFDLLTIETRGNEVKRLIHTETSERCFLVASQVIGELKLGANPCGPAGGGKTETIKALGQLFGCQVIVHNCDQTNTTEALERLIWGLAHTGLWGCFDEFNRLSLNTLSSVSGQLELVQTSLRSSDGDRTITVELSNGHMKSIDPKSAFFITMNPSDAPTLSSSRGYRGRRRLPANLRSLFLPIVMNRVQLDSIVREMLLAFRGNFRYDDGLSMSANLAEKLGSDIARWISWMRSNLQIDRCEWDLRLVMSILARFFRSSTGAVECSDSSVSQIMIKCIVNEVGPRLSGEHEINLLSRSLHEFFDYNPADVQLNELLGDNLQQLERQLEMRPGVILLGDDSSTNSSLWRSLAAEKNRSAPVVSYFQLNPKSCSERDLLGHFDEMSSSSSRGTAKWRDGLLTKLVRDSLNLLQTSSMQQVWLVLTGPIDPDWIESLNSVLDDNRVLTLSSGERLNFVLSRQDDNLPNKWIKLIFETSHISNASPATISRLGLINLKQNSGKYGGKNIDETPQPDHASLTVVQLALDINKHDSTRLVRNYLMMEEELHRDHIGMYEFICFEGSNSKHLIELLELINANSLDQTKRLFLVIHNLHLIESEDDWKTRTFVEFLLHVVVTTSYYDKEHNLKFISPRLRIVVTASEESRRLSDFKRLLAVAKERQTLNEDNLAAFKLQPNSYSEISLSALINWCRSKPEDDSSNAARPPTIMIVETAHQNAALDLTRQLKAELSRGEQTSTSGGLEICSMNNSIESSRTLETLSRLIQHEGHAEIQTVRRRLLLLDSLQMHLLKPELKAQLYFLLNLVEFKGFQFETLELRCLFIVNGAHLEGTEHDPDHLFWWQLAAIPINKQQEARHCSMRVKFSWAQPVELNTDNEIKNFLTSLDTNAGNEVSLLIQVVADFFQGDGGNLSFEQRRSFLSICAKISAKLRKRAETQSSLLNNGLKRLAEFDQMVERTRELRKADEVQLNERKRHIETLLEKINTEIESCRKQSEQLIHLRQMQEAKTKEVALQREELESKLANVLPKLEASKREIDDCLRPEALNEIKSLRSPPKAIKDILEVLFLVLIPSNGDGEFMDWPSMRSYLTKFSLRDELTAKFDFEKRLADERLVAKLEHEISSRRQSFQLDQAARVSSAIVPIVKWLLATCEYGQALIRVRPLTNRMRTLEREAAQLGEASEQLEIAQNKLDQKIVSDQKELLELNLSYEQARTNLDSNKSHLDRAQSVRSSLAKPVERWRKEIDQYEDLLDNHNDSLHWLCLIGAMLTLNAGNSMEFKEQIEKWLEIVKRHKFKLKPKQNVDLMHSFLAGYSNLLLESISDQLSDDSAVRRPADLCIELDLLGTKQIDHLVNLLAIKLNLHLNSSQLPYISMESDRSVDSLRQYLTYKQILCSRAQDLVLVQTVSSPDWLGASKEAFDSSKGVILLLEISQSNPMLILDIIDSFLSQCCIDEDMKRVILFGCKTNNFRPELRQLLRVFDLNESDSRDSIRLEMDIGNHLLELCEPELASEIMELESKLTDQRDHVKRQELNLISRLMLTGRNQTRSNSDQELSSQNELVRLLLELDQMNESLAVGIEQISSKLSALQTKRDKFQTITKQLAQFYAEHLAPLKSHSSFYNLTPRQLVALFTRYAPSTTSSHLVHIIEHVMCSMRADDRQTLLDSLSNSPIQNSHNESLDRVSLNEASKRAADIKLALIKLIEMPNPVITTYDQAHDQSPRLCLLTSNSLSSVRLAIVFHDARKSSPQMELDEFFMRQQSKLFDPNRNLGIQYVKLYASSATGNGSLLEEQLDRILSRRRSLPHAPLSESVRESDSSEAVKTSYKSEVQRRPRLVKCVCIANAHLAASWINTRLMSVIEANLGTGTIHSSNAEPVGDERDREQLLIVILVAESDLSTQSRHDFSSEFNSNLLDEAYLKFWYDELGLELVDRWNLYQLSLINETVHNKELRKQLVLFHAVCQELNTNEIAGSRLKCAWEMGQNYSFDYEQLRLAMKLLDMLTDSRGTIERVAFCHHIETIVYGARIETSQDEILLKRLVDQLLRTPELASKNWERFERLVESRDVAARRQSQDEFIKRLMNEPAPIRDDTCKHTK